MNRTVRIIAPIALTFCSCSLLGQQSFLPSIDISAAGTAVVASTSSAQEPALTARWLDLKALDYSARYRATKNWHGRDLFDFGQEKYVADGLLKLDANAKYTIHFHASTGRYFNWSYADLIGGQYKDSVVAARAFKTPAETAALKIAVALDPNGAVYSAGIPSRGGYFFPRQLFFSATPLKQFTFEFGSLAIEHGQNTEITSFDDDGYISGERVRLHDPSHLFFSEIDATWAYLGSPLTPNFFSRGTDLGKSNYQQYLVQKNFPKHIVASTDFTLTNGTQTFREGIFVKLPGAVIVDSVKLELYQRLKSVAISGISFAGGSGYSIHARKLIFKKLESEAGYADIDERYSVYGGSIYLATVGFAWNGDAYETGKRAYVKSSLKLAPGVSAFGFYTHTVVAPTIGHNLQGLNAGIDFDFKTLIDKTKRVF
jgi:hypothetical protein